MCSAAACTAVGSYNLSTAMKSLIESWNGTTWSVVPSPSPAGLTTPSLACRAYPRRRAPPSASTAPAASAKPSSNRGTAPAGPRCPAPSPGSGHNTLASVQCLSAAALHRRGRLHQLRLRQPCDSHRVLERHQVVSSAQPKPRARQHPRGRVVRDGGRLHRRGHEGGGNPHRIRDSPRVSHARYRPLPKRTSLPAAALAGTTITGQPPGRFFAATITHRRSAGT